MTTSTGRAAQPGKAPLTIWTRLAMEPVTEPLARALVPIRGVTPNGVTLFAFGCAVAAAGCFLAGELRWGGALFLLRYLADCVDGKLARLRGTSSARGALLDIGADVVGIHLTSAALAYHLVAHAQLALGWALGLMAVIGCYNWALAHRKHLASLLGHGDGGSVHDWHTEIPGIKQWVAFAKRINMAAFPWVLEVEITILGLAPLLLPPEWVATTFIVGTCCYVGFTVVNLRRCWRLAGDLTSRSMA